MTENEIRINETTMWREWITVRGLEPITLQDIDDRLAELKQQVKVEPEVKVNFAEVLDDMIKELQTEQQTIQNANNDDDWEKYCWDVCDHQLKILYQLRSKISA